MRRRSDCDFAAAAAAAMRRRCVRAVEGPSAPCVRRHHTACVLTRACVRACLSSVPTVRARVLAPPLALASVVDTRPCGTCPGAHHVRAPSPSPLALASTLTRPSLPGRDRLASTNSPATRHSRPKNSAVRVSNTVALRGRRSRSVAPRAPSVVLHSESLRRRSSLVPQCASSARSIS